MTDIEKKRIKAKVELIRLGATKVSQDILAEQQQEKARVKLALSLAPKFALPCEPCDSMGAGYLL